MNVDCYKLRELERMTLFKCRHDYEISAHLQSQMIACHGGKAPPTERINPYSEENIRRYERLQADLNKHRQKMRKKGLLNECQKN